MPQGVREARRPLLKYWYWCWYSESPDAGSSELEGLGVFERAEELDDPDVLADEGRQSLPALPAELGPPGLSGAAGPSSTSQSASPEGV